MFFYGGKDGGKAYIRERQKGNTSRANLQTMAQFNNRQVIKWSIEMCHLHVNHTKQNIYVLQNVEVYIYSNNILRIYQRRQVLHVMAK
jgi:hypothetical protein